LHNHFPHISDDAFDNLFCSYYKSLRAYAYRYVDDLFAAEDIVQDVFLQLWEKRGDLDKIQSMRSYLFTSVFNKASNYTKHKNVEKGYQLRQDAARAELEAYYHSQIRDNQESILTRELEQQIAEGIQSMPEQCRKVFILSREHGLKNAEIAEHLGVSLKAVEKHISKALALLRARLKDYLMPIILFFFKRSAVPNNPD